MLSVVLTSLRSTGNIDIINVYVYSFSLFYFALYFIPIFLFLVVNDEDILNNYLIITRFPDIDTWWANKFKLLAADTALYSAVLNMSALLGALLFGAGRYLSPIKMILFIIVSFAIIYLSLLAIGIVYLTVSFVSHTSYVGFIAGWLFGSLDYILSMLGLCDIDITSIGILQEVFAMFSSSEGRPLFFILIFSLYLIFLNMFLYFLAVTLLKRSDIYRGRLS
jgi:hypothetical protein